MSAVLYGLLIAHFMAYKDQYANIGVMFASTMCIRILTKVAGAKEQSDLILVGGGALTVGQVAVLLKEITKRGMSGTANPSANPNGLMGELLDTVKGLIAQ